jgi:hypothetical protein
MVLRRAQRFGGEFWVVVDFAAADDAIKDVEHRRDSDQEAQAAPLDSLRSGELLVHRFSLADYFQVGQIGQRYRHDTVAAKVERVGMTPM